MRRLHAGRRRDGRLWALVHDGGFLLTEEPCKFGLCESDIVECTLGEHLQPPYVCR